MRHEVIWTQPPPIYPNLSFKFVPERAAALQTPAILRFASDSFMDDFMNLLASEPQRLGELRVKPETWRGFTAGPEARKPAPGAAVLRHLRIFRPPTRTNDLVSNTPLPPSTTPANVALKLYQPAHQRHYLVTSSLVCRVPGFPDRTVDAVRDERAGFVLRRLLPPAADNTDVSTWGEHAWIPGARGAAWRQIATGGEKSLVEAEELLPMFGVQFDEPGRQKRRLFAGVIPTGKREAYLGAPKSTSEQAPGVTSRTSRKILLRTEVIEPWKSLVARAHQVNRALVATGDEAPDEAQKWARLKIEREQIQSVSWLILLDFARYLSTYVNPVWRAIITPSLRPSLNDAQERAADAINETVFSRTLRDDFGLFFQAAPSTAYAESSVDGTLREALAHFGTTDGGVDATLERMLEFNDQPFDFATSVTTGDSAWPNFLFPLADPIAPSDPTVAPVPPALAGSELEPDDLTPVPPDADEVLAAFLARFDGLAALIVRALEDPPEPLPEPAVPTAAVAPAAALRGWFRIRCIYDRPQCEPLHGAVVSNPTEPFEIAGYFDPDAPARPIRIGLPIDTTPAGLRKFDKNTAFVISDTLCGQIRRMKGMTFADLVFSILPWPFHRDLPGSDKGPCRKGGLELGMICSLSIPIITLCALFLLIIMVTLLDIIFRWLPYFIICFPVPGLKAKFKPPGA
ncbi:MAG: hypothetical protein ACREF9_00045 [Opitutaceae bacterium]